MRKRVSSLIELDNPLDTNGGRSLFDKIDVTKPARIFLKVYLK